MITVNVKGGIYQRQSMEIKCKSTDVKPLNSTGGINERTIENGSTLVEMDSVNKSVNVYIFNYDDDEWIMM